MQKVTVVQKRGVMMNTLKKILKIDMKRNFLRQLRSVLRHKGIH